MKNFQKQSPPKNSSADIEGVLPHQLTRKIVEHFDTVFTPRGIRYETHRTSQARQMKFSHDGNDADDANDAEIDITQLFKWDISQTASSASLASQRSRKESKHGRSVATGHPAEKPATRRLFPASFRHFRCTLPLSTSSPAQP